MEKSLFSHNIRHLRRKKQLTYSKLAAQAGLSAARVVRLECGAEAADGEAAALCRALDVTEKTLLHEKL